MADGTESTGGMKLVDLITQIKKMSKGDQNQIKTNIGDVAEDMSNATDDQIKFLKRQNEMLAETAELVGDIVEASKQRTKVAERNIEMFIRENDLEGDRAEGMRDAMKDIKKFGQISSGALGDFTEEQKNLLGQYKEQVDLEEGLNSIREDGLVLADKLGAAFGLQKKYKDSILGSTTSLLKKMGEEGVMGDRARKAMKAYMLEVFSFKNIGLNVFNAIKDSSVKMFESFDNAQAALAVSTGQGDKFRDTLHQVGREGHLMGITMDAAGKAIGVLVDQTSNFNSLSETNKVAVASTVAQMEKLGVSTTDSAAIFQNFNQVLGMSATEAVNTQRDLAMAGVSIGVNAATITKNFNASLSTLMVYGKGAIDVFKGIQAGAKAAGVETSTLLAIASKFDTFAGSAEGVGKMNSLLGTQLSTTQMLMATEDERIRMLVESVQSQGIAFQDMDRFTQKAIANAAGITDMAEANKIFGMSLDQYDENEKKLKSSADAQKKFEDAVSKTVPVMDKFTLLGASMVVALEPFLETLEKAADNMIEFFEGMTIDEREDLAGWLSFGAALMALYPILKAGSWLFTGMKTLGAVVMPLVAGATTATATGIGTVGTASGIATPLVTAFGHAMAAGAVEAAAFLGSIALAAFGISGVLLGVAAIVYTVTEAFRLLFDITGQAFSWMFSTDEAEVQLAEFEARSAEAMAAIVTGDHVGALGSVKQLVEEVNKMGQNVEVRSTIENLALITAGKASSMTGERVTASKTSVTANVKNFFEGMEMTLNVDGANFKAYVASVANGDD
tara:strand:+ start:442 stop:2805 length:2364 start_codon:yes stop_codon:yes gene_type:complete